MSKDVLDDYRKYGIVTTKPITIYKKVREKLKGV